MGDQTIHVGGRVRVRLPRNPYCHLHDQANAPTDGLVGEVVRTLDGTDHSVAVVFDLWCMGTRWSDWFRPSEVELLEEDDGRPTVPLSVHKPSRSGRRPGRHLSPLWRDARAGRPEVGRAPPHSYV